MKKKLLAGMATVLLIVGMAGAASATPFADMVDFDETDGVGVNAGIDYNEIENAFTYTHTLTGLTSPAYTLVDATLSLRHNGNSDNQGEVWVSAADDGAAGIPIGLLSQSTTGNPWITDAWGLSSAVLDLMDSGNPWKLTINLYDTTTGMDKLMIDWSILSGNYITDPGGPGEQNAPVPEPATIFLMGTGLVGLVSARRKKKAC